jgi:hypothetical protein
VLRWTKPRHSSLNGEKRMAPEKPRTRPLSGIITELAFLGLAEGCQQPTAQARSLCVALASSAWNQAVGLLHNHPQILQIIRELAADDPSVWNDLRTTDWREIHNRMISYKLRNYPHDCRKIARYGYVDGKVHIEYTD